MRRFYMTIGLPASGKSTRALEMVKQNPNLKRVNRDSLRAMIDGEGRWSSNREKLIVKTRDTLISLFLSEGFDVICDDTNLDPKVRKHLRDLAKQHGAVVQTIDFRDVPYEECVARDLKRPNSVGENVIKRMWLEHIANPIQPPVADLPWCVIVDLDGTLADISHRSPYDASTCEEDAPRNHVVAAVAGLAEYAPVAPAAVFAFSGREDTYREQTWNWLGDVLHVDGLFMREVGDLRKDSVIKRELYKDHIEGKYNVFAVVDDRPQVIRQWRELGLNVIDVSEKMGLEF